MYTCAVQTTPLRACVIVSVWLWTRVPVACRRGNPLHGIAHPVFAVNTNDKRVERECFAQNFLKLFKYKKIPLARSWQRYWPLVNGYSTRAKRVVIINIASITRGVKRKTLDITRKMKHTTLTTYSVVFIPSDWYYSYHRTCNMRRFWARLRIQSILIDRKRTNINRKEKNRLTNNNSVR